MKGNIFIKRPVMAMSIAIVILIIGAISYFNLPVVTKDGAYVGFLSRAKVLDSYKDVIVEESDD